MLHVSELLSVSPLMPIFAAVLITVVGARKLIKPPVRHVADFAVAIVLWLLLPLQSRSIVPWWGPVTCLAVQWPDVASVAPLFLKHGGPLGPGCSKLVQVLVAVLLWRLLHQEWPPLTLGPLPGVSAWIGILILAGLVNIVISFWSNMTDSRGDHPGVNDMVKDTYGRSLSLQEHVRILGLAFFNGACEEITSRFFWMAEFEVYMPPLQANIAQAALFGIWHYHGIPSGWTGVCLTFVYGGIMGCLYQYGEGLFLPIVTHGIADYYIFTIIARRKKDGEKAS
jgi:membrane protease YdiL (CAAX protease family)